MARRKNPRGSVGNTVAAHELALYAESNSDLYRQRIEPVIKNLSRKRSKNIYDRALALKLWKYVADDAAQRYTKEHGGGKGYGIFAAATRRKAAAEIQDHYLNLCRRFTTSCGSKYTVALPATMLLCISLRRIIGNVFP